MNGDIDDEIKWFERLLHARNVENILVAVLIAATYVVIGSFADMLVGRLSAFIVAGAATIAGSVVWVVGKSRLEQVGDEQNQRLAFQAELFRQAAILYWFPAVAFPLVVALAFHAWHQDSILSTVLLIVIVVGQTLNRVVAGKFRAHAQTLGS